MLRSIYFPDQGNVCRDLTIDDIRQKLKIPEGWFWVSLEQMSDEEIIEILGSVFNFHPLAIEDCLSSGYQAPKIDDFGDYLFIIVHALDHDDQLEELRTIEFNVFLSEKFIVTSNREPVKAVQDVWALLDKDQRLHLNGADFLCHAILDHLVDDFMPVIDQMDEEIEMLEDQVLSKPDPRTLDKILTLKHAIMALRRVISPQREVMNRLSRDDFPMIDRKSQIYFRDIYDHLVRIQDLSESIRDIVSGSMDIYLNSTSLRLNEIMKALTIVSTIFLPLSFVAGIYGMNFEFMPEIRWAFGYPFVWFIFIGITLGMLIYFKKKGWF